MLAACETAAERGVTGRMTAKAASDWRIVALAFGAGIVAATHVGKLPPALTVLRLEIGAGLVTAGWIASTIAATGAALGLVGGAMADRIGPRRALAAGLALLTLGSLLGSLAQGPAAMLASRFVEGVGFTAATVTGGVIVARATAPTDRARALAVWASYMPLGFAGMTLASAAGLEALGWRAIWLAAAAATAGYAALAWRATAGWAGGAPRRDAALTAAGDLARTLRQAGGVLVALAFGLYAAQHIGMMNWLPAYMAEVHAAGALAGAGATAAVLFCNAGGNYAAAWAMGRGARVWALLSLGAAGMAVAEVAIFFGAPAPGPAGAAAAALLPWLVFGFAGGVVSGPALAAPPVYAPLPALVGTMSGLMVMGSNTGQLVGPPMLAAARKAAGGWDGAAWPMLALAAAGLASALATRGFEARARARAALAA